MSLTFEIKGALPEHAVRHIIREAEGRMVDGVDAKAALVLAAQEYLASEHAFAIKGALDDAQETADMLGVEPDIYTPLTGVKAQIGAAFDTILAGHAPGDMGALACALAKAVVDANPVTPADRGKWLAKIGIVKAHIDALEPAATTPAAVPPPPADDDADPTAMIGRDAPEVPAPPRGLDVPPPPPPVNPRDAFVLVGEALDLDDAALAKRLGVSRSTIHNYLNGKTAKVKVTLGQARLMVAEIDLRTAKLRQAADIFAQVRD